MDHHPSSDISLYEVLGIINKLEEGHFLRESNKIH